MMARVRYLDCGCDNILNSKKILHPNNGPDKYECTLKYRNSSTGWNKSRGGNFPIKNRHTGLNKLTGGNFFLKHTHKILL